jgi:hypothetical protein
MALPRDQLRGVQPDGHRRRSHGPSCARRLERVPVALDELTEGRPHFHGIGAGGGEDEVPPCRGEAFSSLGDGGKDSWLPGRSGCRGYPGGSPAPLRQERRCLDW